MLDKGLKFSLASRNISVEEIILSIEIGIKELRDPIKYVIRKYYFIIIRKAKPPKRKIKKSEFESSKSLNNNLDIVIHKVDKGGEVINTPINEATEVINYITDPDITMLVDIFLTSTFFNFEVEFYEQICGVTKGSPFPPVVAKLVMEDFESKPLDSD